MSIGPKYGLKIIFFPLLITFFAGCASFREFVGLGLEKPTITLTSVTLQKITFQDLEMQFMILVSNPNSFALELKEISYSIEVGKEPLTQDHIQKIVHFAPKSSSSVQVPFSLKTKNILRVFQRILNNPHGLKTSVKGELLIDTCIGEIKIPFHQQADLLKNF